MVKTSQKKPHDYGKHFKTKSDLSISIPLRMSSYICKRPVTIISSHPDNEVRYHHWEETLDKPQQFWWQKRLQGLQAYSSTGEELSTLHFIKNFQHLLPTCRGESPSGILAGSLHSCPVSTAVQISDLGGVISGSALGITQFPYRRLVTEEDIRTQERKVKMARERLARAMVLDNLASEVEKERGQKGHPQKHYEKQRRRC
ncbi:Methyl-CpG-binding domain protein 3-like 1 [Galemys pyrenaicus]|uniref:Methyl-CpG-binding domain protein 3-like 1 n=1 Tax=Galemys pyrenaicus TaxID=202257 RepID=A0A8J6DV44_GALPY|nr:Methyl-CpG-binding domain protein 3-like 1 [Galemys pyrenaicus]